MTIDYLISSLYQAVAINHVSKDWSCKFCDWLENGVDNVLWNKEKYERLREN